jgi:hypothetical protein
MRKPVGLAIFAVAIALGGCATPPFKGNDTGGIISWTPEAEIARHEIAAEHCARYGKIHRITSNHRRYGDYIGFSCYWPRGAEPYPPAYRHY